jgi:hypothetical protein
MNDMDKNNQQREMLPKYADKLNPKIWLGELIHV